MVKASLDCDELEVFLTIADLSYLPEGIALWDEAVWDSPAVWAPPDYGYVSVSDDVRGFTLERGRQGQWDQLNAATLTLELNNNHGKYSVFGEQSYPRLQPLADVAMNGNYHTDNPSDEVPAHYDADTYDVESRSPLLKTVSTYSFTIVVQVTNAQSIVWPGGVTLPAAITGDVAWFARTWIVGGTTIRWYLHPVDDKWYQFHSGAAAAPTRTQFLNSQLAFVFGAVATSHPEVGLIQLREGVYPAGEQDGFGNISPPREPMVPTLVYDYTAQDGQPVVTGAAYSLRTYPVTINEARPPVAAATTTVYDFAAQDGQPAVTGVTYSTRQYQKQNVDGNATKVYTFNNLFRDQPIYMPALTWKIDFNLTPSIFPVSKEGREVWFGSTKLPYYGSTTGTMFDTGPFVLRGLGWSTGYTTNVNMDGTLTAHYKIPGTWSTVTQNGTPRVITLQWSGVPGDPGDPGGPGPYTANRTQYGTPRALAWNSVPGAPGDPGTPQPIEWLWNAFEAPVHGLVDYSDNANHTWRLSNIDQIVPYQPAVAPSVKFPLFRGFATEWREVPDPIDNRMVLTAIDESIKFAEPIPGEYLAGTDAQPVADRINAILDRSGSSSPRAIRAGTATVTNYETSRTLLDELHVTATSDGGWFFVDNDGTLTYLNKDRVLGRPSTTGGLPPIFGDSCHSDVELPYAAIEPVIGDSEFGNVVTVTNVSQGTDSPETSIAVNNDSIAAVGTAYWKPSQLVICNAGYTQALANFQLSVRSNAYYRIDSFECYPAHDERLWPILLGLRIGDALFVRRRPPDSGLISFPQIVDGYRIEATPSMWKMTIRCTSAEDIQFANYWDHGLWDSATWA